MLVCCWVSGVSAAHVCERVSELSSLQSRPAEVERVGNGGRVSYEKS